MPKICRRLTGLVLWLSAGLLLGCGKTQEPATAKAAPPTPVRVPSVVEVVGHYAVQLAKGTRLTTAASRHYGGDSLPSLNPAGTSFILSLPTCNIEVAMDQEQRPESVYVSARRRAQPPAARATFPQPNRLVRLGELRRIFGPGEVGPARLTKLEVTRRYSVRFPFLLSSADREVEISASLPTPEYADSTMVDAVFISVRE